MAIPGPPEYSLTDSNQVNMTTGNIEINEQGVSIGSGEFALEHRLLYYSNNLKLFADNFSGALYVRHSDMPLPDVRATFGSLLSRVFKHHRPRSALLAVMVASSRNTVTLFGNTPIAKESK